MGRRVTAIATMLVIWAASLPGSSGTAVAQSAGPAHTIPNSLRMEHEDAMEQLNALAKHRGPVGEEARKLLVLFRRHHAREREFILPPLTLLPALARGEVTPDMRWALQMADRVKAENEEIFREHSSITDGCNALLAAADRAHDKAAREFAQQAVADSLNDLELLEPTVLVIGELLRSKLPPAP
jgi:hypothetical protein